MASRHPVGVKPPVIRFRHLGAQVIVVGIRCADEQIPFAWEFVGEYARLSLFQGWRDRITGAIYLP